MALNPKKKFLNWVKNHYACKHLRWEAAKTEVIYEAILFTLKATTKKNSSQTHIHYLI